MCVCVYARAPISRSVEFTGAAFLFSKLKQIQILKSLRCLGDKIFSGLLKIQHFCVSVCVCVLHLCGAFYIYLCNCICHPHIDKDNPTFWNE